MTTNLDAIGQSMFPSSSPAAKPQTALAALGPRTIELSRNKMDATRIYNVTPEHTVDARERLGPGKLLCVEQKLALESDPTQFRAIGRLTLRIYRALPIY